MAQDKFTPKQDPTKDKNTSTARSFVKDDLPLIRKALIVLIASLLLSAALVSAGRALRLKQQSNMTQTQAQHIDATNKLHQAVNDTQEIHDYQPKYVALREQGFVGDEKRLDWTEHIKRIRENRMLLPITYEISVQKVFQADPEILSGDLELRGSKMRLQMSLLHEEDLLNFLDDLRHKGFYTTQECKVKRAPGDTADVRLPLEAECTIYWLTLGEQVTNPEPIPQ